MQVIAFVFAALFAVAAANPQPAKFGLAPQVVNEVPLVPTSFLEDASRNVIADLVSSLVQRLSQILQDLGLDPLNISGGSFAFGLPVPSLFGVSITGRDLSLGGVSNIVINQLSYGLLSQRLTFDISLPEIVIDIGDSELAVLVLSRDFIAQYSGRVAIQNAGISGAARVSIGVITGISIRELDLNFYLGGLDANINNFNLLGRDYTAQLDNFINVDLFNAIKEHEEAFSELITIIAYRILDQIL